MRPGGFSIAFLLTFYYHPIIKLREEKPVVPVVTIELIYQLVGYPHETEWIEFKRNYKDAVAVGRDISALANAAAYHDRPFAYKIWGVDDETHELVGTDFQPLGAKAHGNQDLPIWLKQHVSVNANYQFFSVEEGSKRFVVLRIARAAYQPVRFESHTYIREGSATTPLTVGSEKEAELWRRLQRAPFEEGIAEESLSFEEVKERLAISEYFELVGMRRPQDDAVAAEALVRQELLAVQDDGLFAITNLGALLVARHLGDFPTLRKRRLRVVAFQGEGRTDIANDVTFDEGYALALPPAHRHLMELIPKQDVHEGAFRRIRPILPERAIRELLANAVIHQDLHDASRSPEVHVFSNRIEFANPGSMLVPTERVLNAQPKTRNGALANILRQMGLCEEEGTGWDIVIEDCEARHLVAPKVTTGDAEGTEVVLYAGDAFSRMTKAERRLAAYWHACLLLSHDSALTNPSLRERFGLTSEKKDVVAVSRLIRECCEEGLLREEDPDVGRRHMRYVPFWV